MIYEYRALGEMITPRENQSTHRETCPSDTMSTTNPACTGLGLNPGLHSDRLAIHLTHGIGQVLLAYCCHTHEFPVHVLMYNSKQCLSGVQCCRNSLAL